MKKIILQNYTVQDTCIRTSKNFKFSAQNIHKPESTLAIETTKRTTKNIKHDRGLTFCLYILLY